jgi:hypothetical protein
MIPPKEAEKLMDYIDKIYPGGVSKFTQNGGDLTYLPECILLSFPERNERLKQEIGDKFKDIPFFFFSDPFDTEPAAFAEIRNELIKILMEDEVGLYAQGVSITLRSCFLLIQSMANLPQLLVTKIRGMITDFEVPRVIFVQPHRVPEVWETLDTNEGKPEEKSKPAKDLDAGTGVGISKDGLTNLKIELNKEQDVMDFLKSLEGM